MVKLTARDDKRARFFFRSLNDCETFKYVFKDHWCNVVWNNPEEGNFDKEMDEWDERLIDVDPKKRAENNLSWGFHLCENTGNDKLTEEQEEFVASMVDRLTNKNCVSNMPNNQ